LIRAETYISGSIPIGSKQKRDAKKCPITVDLPLDDGTVPVYFDLRWQRGYSNKFAIAHVVEDRVRRSTPQSMGGFADSPGIMGKLLERTPSLKSEAKSRYGQVPAAGFEGLPLEVSIHQEDHGRGGGIEPHDALPIKALPQISENSVKKSGRK
jgi:hypothetical protein